MTMPMAMCWRRWQETLAVPLQYRVRLLRNVSGGFICFYFYRHNLEIILLPAEGFGLHLPRSCTEKVGLGIEAHAT